MKILVTVQNKGGVGKTTVCRLISEYLTRQGKKVLGIDLDSQCNFSRRFLTMDIDSTDPDGIMPPLHPDYDDDDNWDGRSSSADIYYSGQVLPYPTYLEGMDILPGNGSQLRAVELVSSENVKEQVHDRLLAFLSQEEVKELYDIIIVDTSPSKGPLTISAVRAATHLIIPTTMEPQTLEGLHGMLQLWRRETKKRTKGDELKIIGILPNMFRKGVALHEGLYETLSTDPGISDLLIPMKLGQRIAFAESDHYMANPRSVFDLPEKDPARLEAEAICKYIKEKLYQ
ncbi:MAG: ParA family protein [Candidatus Paceibacterota bacterium]|jgi:chromosome partitioning protein